MSAPDAEDRTPLSAQSPPLELAPPLLRPHPLLTCDDRELAAAFERLLKEPSFSKIKLTAWEFTLAADAPSVFEQWGGFTWKQRKCLREIVKKIMGGSHVPAP